MSNKKNKNKKQNQTQTQNQKQQDPKPQTQTQTTETKRTLKSDPIWKDSEGNLIKLKRADFPYDHAGIIAYCNYRIEYWQIKKQEMLKKADPNAKLNTKRAKLLAAIEAIDEKIKVQGASVEGSE